MFGAMSEFFDRKEMSKVYNAIIESVGVESDDDENT